jgi:hypothetical protein
MEFAKKYWKVQEMRMPREQPRIQLALTNLAAVSGFAVAAGGMACSDSSCSLRPVKYHSNARTNR